MILTIGNMRKSIATRGPLPLLRLLGWLEDRELGVMHIDPLPKLDTVEGWVLRWAEQVLYERQGECE